MSQLNSFCGVSAEAVTRAAKEYGTPLYLYDEKVILEKCESLLSMPNAYGLTVRYAMKANSNKSILKKISSLGLKIDASSMNEVRRAHIAGIGPQDIILTTQEAPSGNEMRELEKMILQGLKYNVCSIRQLRNIAPFASKNRINLAIRYHPGIGAGESVTRNTGDKYSCFGIHLSDLEDALEYSGEWKITFDHVHVHIGSGGDPAVWQSNIDSELAIVERYFPDAQTVSFGGGLREARMPDESPANIAELGTYAKERIEEFDKKTNRKLRMEIEPGTFVIASSGFIVTTVIDKKKTGTEGHNFLVLDGGMEVNTRPLLYASRHPFYIVSQKGSLLSSEFDDTSKGSYEAVPVGRCCESGDSQSLNAEGLSIPRKMAEPEIGDFFVIGGAGAYCSAMTLVNYNSHVQAPEILYTREGELRIIRRRQTLQQMLANEA